MGSHEALNKCIGRFTHQVAHRFGKSDILVYKWQQPLPTGIYNPLDKVNDIIKVAEQCGQGDDALAPIHYLEGEHGIIGIRLPLPGQHQEVSSELVKVIKEFSDLAKVTAEGLADNRISINDNKKIEKEGLEAIRAIHTLMHIARESVK